MNIAQLSEQLKDVPQNRLIDYARNPNSVVPQFLALAEIQRRQQLSAQVAPPATTVAEEVLAKAQPAPQMDPRMIQAMQQPQPQMEQAAQQLPENQPGVAQLQSGMGQGFAPGGLVAFATGDLVEDDEDDRELSQLFPESPISFEDFQTIAQKAKSGISSLMNAFPQSYEKTLAAQKSGATDDVNAALKSAAEKHGVPADLMNRIAGIESSGNPSAANKLSSAKGLLGITKGTWQGLGGKEGEQLDAFKNADLGALLARKNAEGLKEHLGRNPTYGEVYAAHNFGLSGAKHLMKLDPDLPMAKAVSPLVMKQNPQFRNKTVGQILNNINTKMGEGIVSLNTGGQIKHFATGDEVKAAMEARQKALDVVNQNLPDTPPSDYAGSLTSWMESPEGIKQLRDRQIAIDAIRRNMAVPSLNAAYQPYAPTTAAQVRAARAAAPAPAAAAPAAASKSPAPLNALDKEIAFTQDMEDQESNKPAVIPIAPPAAPGAQANAAAPGAAPVVPVAPKSKADLLEEAMARSIAQQEADIEKNRKMQLGLSLLGAAATGLQSTSPYFGVGAGATLAGGVNTYSNLKKQEADAMKDLNAMRMGSYKYGLSRETALENQKLAEKRLDAMIGKTPTPEERATEKFNLALSRNPQILEINRLITEEQKSGTMTPERYNQYQANIQKVINALAKQYKVDPDVFVQLSPVVDPTKPPTKHWWDNLFGGSSSTPTAGAVDTNNPLLK